MKCRLELGPAHGHAVCWSGIAPAEFIVFLPLPKGRLLTMDDLVEVSGTQLGDTKNSAVYRRVMMHDDGTIYRHVGTPFPARDLEDEGEQHGWGV